jgi:hypothetical protein
MVRTTTSETPSPSTLPTLLCPGTARLSARSPSDRVSSTGPESRPDENVNRDEEILGIGQDHDGVSLFGGQQLPVEICFDHAFAPPLRARSFSRIPMSRNSSAPKMNRTGPTWDRSRRGAQSNIRRSSSVRPFLHQGHNANPKAAGPPAAAASKWKYSRLHKIAGGMATDRIEREELASKLMETAGSAEDNDARLNCCGLRLNI